MKDKIQIQNLEVFANHGVYEAENILGQKFLIDATLWLNTRLAGQSDQLDDSVSYGDICRFIAAKMREYNYKLLETVAEKLAEGILLTFPMAEKVDITVKKPWAPVKMHIDYTAVSIEREWHTAYIGLGSNMGDRRQYLEDALTSMREHPLINNLESASIIETEPYGYTEQDHFLNTVCKMKTLMTAWELLHFLQKLEQNAQRVREIHWGPRTLDLDILLYDQLVTEDAALIIPHPEIEKRMFVLESLCELNPYGVHPLLRERFLTLKKKLEKNEKE